MRVHLLLILFFASTILARSARNRRDTNVTTEQPLIISTTEANNGNTTTDVRRDNCHGIICGIHIFSQPLKILLKLFKLILLAIKNTLSTFLKTFNSTGDFMLHSMIQPIVIVLERMMKWMLQFF